MLATVKLIVLAFATHQSLKAYLHLMFLNAVQPLNILLLYATLLISKLDKSSEVKEVQSSNIEFICVPIDVSKLDKSRDVKPLQPLNI